MEKSEYIEYLKSEDWRERRKTFLELSDNTCSMCGAKATQVHHLSYENLGEEELDIDVIVLCKDCHKDVHQNKSGYGDYGEWT